MEQAPESIEALSAIARTAEKGEEQLAAMERLLQLGKTDIVALLLHHTVDDQTALVVGDRGVSSYREGRLTTTYPNLFGEMGTLVDNSIDFIGGCPDDQSYYDERSNRLRSRLSDILCKVQTTPAP